MKCTEQTLVNIVKEWCYIYLSLCITLPLIILYERMKDVLGNSLHY